MTPLRKMQKSLSNREKAKRRLGTINDDTFSSFQKMPDGQSFLSAENIGEKIDEV